MDSRRSEAPLACVIDAIPRSERPRYRELRRLLIQQAPVEELADGFAFRLPERAGVLVHLAEWLELERRCCPFVDVDVAWPAGGAPVVRLRGRPGVKELLALELGLVC